MIHTNAIKDSFICGIRDGLPICFGYLSVSFAFGIFAVNKGLAVWQSVVMSMTNVTSAGQLAAVPIVAAGTSLAELALSQFVINMRYALMSISLSQKLGDTVRTADRFVIAFMNTDEIFAVATGQAQLVGRRYMYGLAMMPYLGWASGTAFGAIAGNVLPEFIVNALGIAIYGMFIAILIPAAKYNAAICAVIVVSCLMSLLFRYLPFLSAVSPGFVIIVCAVTVSALFAVIRPVNAAHNGGEL